MTVSGHPRGSAGGRKRGGGTAAWSGRGHSDAAQVELSVIVPMRDAGSTIVAQLEALRAQRWSGIWELVISDNGSRDDGPSLVRAIAEVDPRVRLVSATAGTGPASARNEGVAQALGASLAFCDADDVVADGWLAAIGQALRSSSVVTGPQLQHHLNPPWLVDIYGRGPGEGPQNFAGIFPFGPSCNLGIRKVVFLEIGGFDITMQVGEDIDLCLRLWHAGHELQFVPDAAIHYRNRTSLYELWKQALRYGEAGPRIVRRLDELGGPRPSRVAGTRRWIWLARRLPLLRERAGRVRWVVVAGGAVGRVIGSVRHRTVFL